FPCIPGSAPPTQIEVLRRNTRPPPPKQRNTTEAKTNKENKETKKRTDIDLLPSNDYIYWTGYPTQPCSRFPGMLRKCGKLLNIVGQGPARITSLIRDGTSSTDTGVHWDTH